MRQGRTLVHMAGAALGLVLAALACTVSLNPASSALPSVTIDSPAPGATVPVNQPLAVVVTASDLNGPGIVRVDLLEDGVQVAALQPPTVVLNFSGELIFTPDTEGAISLSAVAVRADGTTSPPATIALQVVGLSTVVPSPSGAATSAGAATTTTGNTSAPTSTSGSTTVRVQARADLDLNIRAGPGPGCNIIGVWDAGDTGYLYERTIGLDYWYLTDYGGQDGWVFHGDLTLLEPDDNIPRVEERGCLYCGDGVCSESEGEFCNTCEADCGACCGDGVCNPAHGEECDICVADCGVCPYCGDGEVNQASEQCDGGGCGVGESCQNCQCVVVCGDGVCAPQSMGENCYVCPADCGSCCGNGVCDGVYGESFSNCPADCPALPSSIDLKENFSEVDDRAVLETLVDIPITTWNYINDDDRIRHMGPMAQDFYHAFGLGEGEDTINILDANGVTLAALKAMYAMAEQTDATLAAQQAQIDALEARTTALEAERRWRLPIGWAVLGALGVFGAGMWLGRRLQKS